MSVASSSPAEPAERVRLGRYELLAKIASGGMATVHLGRVLGAAGFERLVAIKQCHPHLMDDEAFRTMFLDEARLAARIHHPNVAAVIDVSDQDGLYLVMEYVEGGRVSDLVLKEAHRSSTVPIPIALRIFIDAMSGLHAAHETRGPDGSLLQLVHRDVSPQNILVGVDGVTRVVDFGVAKAEARATVTSDNTIKGKLSYMAPEQLRMEKVTAQSDVFAAGAVLWEVLTGKRLFAGDTRSDTAQLVVLLPIPRPTKHNAAVPRELEAVVMKALERSPEKRFTTARELAEALDRLPIRPATQLEVGDYAAALLSDELSQRRLLLTPSGEPTQEDLKAVSGVQRTGSTTLRWRARRARWAAGMLVVLLAALLAWWLAAAGARSPETPSASPEPPVVVDPSPPAPLAAPNPIPAAAPEPEVAPARATEPTPRPRRRPRRPAAPAKMGEFRPNTI